MTDSIICGGVISTVTVLHSLTPNPRSKLQFGATRTKHNKTESRKTTKLTPGDLYSTFLSTSRLQRVPQLLRNVRCFHPGGVEKCFKVAEILAFALMRPRRCGGKKESSLDMRGEVVSPARAAVGHSRDSCRLWHEEQELRAGCVKGEEALSMRGEVRTAQNH